MSASLSLYLLMDLVDLDSDHGLIGGFCSLLFHLQDDGKVGGKNQATNQGSLMCAHTHDRQVEHNVVDHLASSISAIDFSLLTSDLPQLHTDAVSQLGKACADWGL
ncbi:hypothetical protein K1719_044989 [Acacia pycnantha]|nr:hypothetical protein K1719_044989 [Acacia pycnantha]